MGEHHDDGTMTIDASEYIEGTGRMVRINDGDVTTFWMNQAVWEAFDEWARAQFAKGKDD